MNSTVNNTNLPAVRQIKPSDTLLEKIHDLKLATYPLCFILLVVGFVLAIISFTRPKIRKHSSALYLLIMVFLDLMWAFGAYIPTLIASANPNMILHPSLCKYTQALEFIGRTGSSLVILMLSLERVLALLFPRRMEAILPKILIVLCAISLAVICAGGSYSALEYAFEPAIRKRCAFVIYGTSAGKNNSPWIIIVVPLVLMFIQLVLNIILAVLIHRKKQSRQVDPLQTAMAAVRQKASSQLNKINLISFVMCLQYWLSNLFYECGRWYFQVSMTRARDKKAVVDEALLVYEILYTVTLISLSVRVYVIAVLSKGIREQTWRALICSDYRSRQRLSEHIKPKQNSQDGLNLDTPKGEDLDPSTYSSANPAMYYEEQL